MNDELKQINTDGAKTYINPDELVYTREFTDQEIEEWLNEDTLT